MYNKSKTYLLPLISEVVHLEKKFLDSIENTFMYVDGEKSEYLCILQDFTFKDPAFTAYEHKLTKNKLFLKCIDLDKQVLYVFNFPKEYIQEFHYLLNSEYSKLLRFWSDMYSNNNNIIPVLVQIKQILYKDKKLKDRLEKELGVKIEDDQELGEYLDIEKETFNINNFKH
jgi:hypothetical protein